MRSWFTNTHSAKKSAVFEMLGNQLDVVYAESSDIKEFIQSLYLLENVPVEALVADGNMLPKESLKVFYIDNNWLECLVDGAMSIGRNCTEDISHDSMVLPEIKRMGQNGSANLRVTRYNRAAQDNVEPCRMGFLLYSELVECWPGTEISCFWGECERNMIKLETIGDSILFCVTDGVFDKIVLTEPVEGLFFGFEREHDKIVKKLVVSEEDKALESNISLPVPFHEEKDGVLNISLFADNMKQALEKAGEASEYFSALEFAHQMIRERVRCEIKMNGSMPDEGGGGYV